MKLRITDWKDIFGQEAAKLAVEVSAGGGHHLLLSGRPRSGKTMIASSLPGLLPALSEAEVQERRAMGLRAEKTPFCVPRPEITPAAMVGGARRRRLGEANHAHGGVLLLDDIPAFRASALLPLVGVLDRGEANGYPARFILVATMRDHPPIALLEPTVRALVPGYKPPAPEPVLLSFDIHIALEDRTSRSLFDSSEDARRRVALARLIQEERFGTRERLNSKMTDEEVKRYCVLGRSEQAFLDEVRRYFSIRRRETARVLRIARTIADLAGSDPIRGQHLAEASRYRVHRFNERFLGEESVLMGPWEPIPPPA
jgi:magnesium chelatase family protein